MPADPPYPTFLPTVEYRIGVLERWRETIEKEGLAKAFAIADEQRRAMREELSAMKAKVEALEDEVQLRRGGSNTIRWIVGGAFVTILLTIGTVLQIAAFLQGG